MAYLALGDWHGRKRITDRCWYSGTPEIDSFDVVDGGHVLLVDIEGPGVWPVVEPILTGHYCWTKVAGQVNTRKDIEHLTERLRSSAEELSRVLVRLTVEGAVSLEDRRYFQEQIVERVSAAFCFLRVDDRRLFTQPTAEDLNEIDPAGFVRTAAERLRRQAEEGSDADASIAAAALQRHFVEQMKLQVG